MIYFKNVPQYGDLEIEKVLFLFDNIPMIFVCRDDKKRYFLCQCVDVIDKFSWMIIPVQKRLLISMMKDEISVLSAFKDSGYDIILADEVKNEIGYRKIPFKNIPLDELPDPDEKLENPDLREYIEQLQQEEIIYKAEKIQDFKIVWKGQRSNIISKIKEQTTVCKPYYEHIWVDDVVNEKKADNKYIVGKNDLIKTFTFGNVSWNVEHGNIEFDRYCFNTDQGKKKALISIV